MQPQSSPCLKCGRPLNEAQFRNNRTLKSCPGCSKNNGEQHVFYDYPDDFGTTPLRSTSVNPDGPQSYCTACRGGHSSTGGIFCEDT